MEGSKKFRAEINKLVKQRAKLELGVYVKILKGENKGKTGFVDSIGSVTDIKDVNSTRVQYLVRLNSDILAYHDSELQVTVKPFEPERVEFT
jgi:hypothetical protein